MRFKFLIAFVVLLAIVPLLPVPEFWITQLNYIGLYTLVVLGLVLLTGIAGLTSFGQAAFVGLGAYTAAYLTLTYAVSPWLTVFAGLVITTVFALVVGWVTLRMSGHYLPLATIAWGLSLYYLLGNMETLGKYDGLMGVPAIYFFDIELNTGRHFYYLLWVIVMLAAIGVTHLLDSRTGRAIRALKGGVTMAEAMGVNTFGYKVKVFLIAALPQWRRCAGRLRRRVSRDAELACGLTEPGGWVCRSASWARALAMRPRARDTRARRIQDRRARPRARRSETRCPKPGSPARVAHRAPPSSRAGTGTARCSWSRVGERGDG